MPSCDCDDGQRARETNKKNKNPQNVYVNHVDWNAAPTCKYNVKHNCKQRRFKIVDNGEYDAFFFSFE